MAKKLRADELLFIQGKAESRTQAKLLIMAGKVRSGPDSLITKPSQMLFADSKLFVDEPMCFVSRGGEKLSGALRHFKISVNGLSALDVGASTGGFTDCLLQSGASSVVCVDVGHGQLHMKLRNDPRVVNIEKVNARNLDEILLPKPNYDIVVGDLSFISLKKVLLPIWNRVEDGGILLLLIKPQFEAEKDEVSKCNGVIKDEAIHTRVVKDIVTFAEKMLPFFYLLGVCESPIRGGDGNKEFLFCARRVVDKDGGI